MKAYKMKAYAGFDLNRMNFADEVLLDGRLLISHTTSASVGNRAPGRFGLTTTTRIEITATDIKHLHLIEYVLVSLALLNLPGKSWTVRYDGGSARLIFTRPTEDLNFESVQKVRDALRFLVLPTLEPGHAN